MEEHKDDGVSQKEVQFKALLEKKNWNAYQLQSTSYSSDEELSRDLSVNLCKALEQFRHYNNALPKTIVIFRDGVGDGEIPYYVVPHKLQAKDIRTLTNIRDAVIRLNVEGNDSTRIGIDKSNYLDPEIAVWFSESTSYGIMPIRDKRFKAMLQNATKVELSDTSGKKMFFYPRFNDKNREQFERKEYVDEKTDSSVNEKEAIDNEDKEGYEEREDDDDGVEGKEKCQDGEDDEFPEGEDDDEMEHDGPWKKNISNTVVYNGRWHPRLHYFSLINEKKVEESNEVVEPNESDEMKERRKKLEKKKQLEAKKAFTERLHAISKAFGVLVKSALEAASEAAQKTGAAEDSNSTEKEKDFGALGGDIPLPSNANPVYSNSYPQFSRFFDSYVTDEWLAKLGIAAYGLYCFKAKIRKFIRSIDPHVEGGTVNVKRSTDLIKGILFNIMRIRKDVDIPLGHIIILVPIN